MRVLLKALICTAAAAAGYGVGVFLGLAALELAGVSMFEGERATLAAFIIGPLGALGGLWGGGWAAQRLFREPTNFGSVARIAAVAFVAINVLAALGAAIGTLSFGGARWTNSAPPNLDFEIRLPVAALGAGDGRQWRVKLDTPHNQMPATLVRPFRREESFVVVSGDVDLAYRTSQRTLSLDVGDGRNILFQLSLPATPASTGWSQWTRVSKVFMPGDARGRDPGDDDQAEIRVRVTVY